MLTNGLIKLSPPCIRKNVGIFPWKASQGAGAWESCVQSWRAGRGQGDRQLSVSRGHAVTPGSPWAARAAPNSNPQPGSKDIPHPWHTQGSAPALPTTALAPAQRCCFLPQSHRYGQDKDSAALPCATRKRTLSLQKICISTAHLL